MRLNGEEGNKQKVQLGLGGEWLQTRRWGGQENAAASVLLPSRRHTCTYGQTELSMMIRSGKMVA